MGIVWRVAILLGGKSEAVVTFMAYRMRHIWYVNSIACELHLISNPLI
jgi:hypothetical protein